MQRFRNILRAVSGKSSKSDKPSDTDQSNELSPNVFNSLKRVLKYLETQSVLPRGLYKEPGFIEEISAIEGLINSGKISEAYLATVRSTHSIAMAIVNVLSTHDPIIPKHLYDHFMSPLANLDALIDDLVAKDPFFDLFMSHLRKVVADHNVNISGPDIAACVGVHILRAVEDDGFDSQTFESQARVKTFEKILVRFIAGKEESERFFASANTANRRSTSLNVPIVYNSTLTDSDKEISETLVPISAAPVVASTPVGSIQERSVKVIFIDPDSKPTQDELKIMLSRYGSVSNVGYKEKLAVVLFSNKQEAQACARDEDGYGLGEDFKIKYLGGQLDPAPAAAPTPAVVDSSMDAKIQHFKALDSTSPLVSTSIDVSTFSPNSSPAKQQNLSHLHASSSAAPSAAADTSMLSKSATGWANANVVSKATWTRPDDDTTPSPPALNNSAMLNSSSLQVSDFTPQATPREPRDHHHHLHGSPQQHEQRETGTALNKSANIGRALPLHPHHHANTADTALDVSRSHALNESLLGVQDLSMVSFADNHEMDTQPPQRHTTAANVHQSATALSVSISASKGKADHKTGASKLLDKGNSDTESSEGSPDEEERKRERVWESYPGAPGSAGALRLPTRTVSPPKPTLRASAGTTASKPEELARGVDSMASSGSWKSAQLTRSPQAATAPHTRSKASDVANKTEGFSSDTAEETDRGEAQGHSNQHQLHKSTSKGPKLVNSYDSSRSTPQRTERQHSGVDISAVNNSTHVASSSSEEDDGGPYHSQLTTGTDAGSRRDSRSSVGYTARFSTESVPHQESSHRQSSDQHHRHHHHHSNSERPVSTVDVSVHSGHHAFSSPGSTGGGSVHTTGEPSGGSSVKKRHIRTIQVGSPLNSSEFNTAGGSGAVEEDDDNYLQEEQSAKGMYSYSQRDVEVESQAEVKVLRSSSAAMEASGKRNHHHHAGRNAVGSNDGGLVEIESNSDGSAQRRSVSHHHHPHHHHHHHHHGSKDKQREFDQRELSPARQNFQKQPHFSHSPGQKTSRTAVESTTDQRYAERNQQEQQSPEVMKLVNSLQERLRLLEAQVNLSSESDSFRRATQARMEEQWTAEILALNLRNQQTFAENALLQQELQTMKIECANTQAALAAAEASRKSLLVASSGLKDRAEHEALDTVIAQKRLIASLEKHLVECRKQAKKLEEDLGFMKNKHCETATSLITWKAKAVELSSRQFGSTGGTAGTAGGTVHSQHSERSSQSGRSPSGRRKGHNRSHNSSHDPSVMDQEFLNQLQQEPADEDLLSSADFAAGTSGRSPHPLIMRDQLRQSSQEAKAPAPDDRLNRAGAGIGSSSGEENNESGLRAHIGGANQSRIAPPPDTSRVEYHIDSTFRSDAHADDDHGNDHPRSSGHGRHKLNEAYSAAAVDTVSDGSDIEIEANRKVAERITRQYISKVPAPQKISSRLEEAAGQYANPGEESCATLSNLEPASTPYAMYLSAVNRIPSAAGLNATVTRPFEPNPIYAHLLQHRSPPAPGNLTATVSAPNLGTNRLPAPSSAVLSTQRPAAGTDLTDRPDATASQTEDADVPATRTQSQYHSVRGGTVPRSSSSSDRYRQPQDDRLTGLFAKRSISPQINAKQAVPYLSTAQLYKSLPLSAEIQEYEQRLQSMTRHKDAFPGQPLLSRSANVSGNNIYSTLARSYNSDQYGRATTNIVGMGGRLHSSSVSAPNRSADVYSSSSRMGGTPRWAQHQYV